MCLTSCAERGGIPTGAVVGRYDRYDYSPSVIQTGDLQQFWWCGRATNPADHSQDSDTILYESINVVTNEKLGPTVVLAETPGAWDSEYTCNPKVIRGSFVNPLGDGQTYTYAMYYVGTQKGTNNSIGVAFSNDGTIWKKYPDPIIPSAYSFGYGPAQPVPYNSDQKQAVWLFYENDTPLPPNQHYQATSTDGVHFTTFGTVTTNGLDLDNPLSSWGDIAYDPTGKFWYAVYNLPTRNLKTTGNIQELGQIGVQLYRIPQDSLLTGTTPWQQLKTFDTNLTGYESLFIAGILRDPYGNLFAASPFKVQLYPSFSNQKVAWNESPGDAASSADPSQWDVGAVDWLANENSQLPLNRYKNDTNHLVTTGFVDPGGNFKLELSLGHVYEHPQNGATIALYSCKAGNKDQFVSLDPGCEGQYISGVNGYAYAKAVSGTNLTAIYRCIAAQDHFVSTDPKCEGSKLDEPLGYILP
jgi:hypothetical protein